MPNLKERPEGPWDDLNTEVVLLLQEEASRQGLSKTEWAARCGMTQQGLSKYLDGHIAMSVYATTRMALGLGLMPQFSLIQNKTGYEPPYKEKRKYVPKETSPRKRAAKKEAGEATAGAGAQGQRAATEDSNRGLQSKPTVQQEKPKSQRVLRAEQNAEADRAEKERRAAFDGQVDDAVEAFLRGKAQSGDAEA